MSTKFEYLGISSNRASEISRKFFSRERLDTSDLMQVCLVLEDSMEKPANLPAFYVRELPALICRLQELQIGSVKIFASESNKDEIASKATLQSNLMHRALRAVRNESLDIFVATETCLCPYTSTGSCAIHFKDGRCNLDETLNLFEKMAVSQALEGANAVGPAGMVPGAVRVVRNALNSNGLHHIGVMPHLIFRSSLYKVYRAAMGIDVEKPASAAFQLDPFDLEESINVLNGMIEEGADSVLVEPSLFILDFLAKISASSYSKIGCFSVSGEYVLLKGNRGSESVKIEVLLDALRAFKRSGARFIATYGAIEVAEYLKDN